MNKDFSIITGRLSRYIYYLFLILLGIIPYLLAPWNSELFELPKVTYLYGITILIALVWLLHLPFTGSLPFRRTPLDIPILLLILSHLASTIFSIHPDTSIWGYYSRFHGGLASFMSYLLLYYAFVTFIPINLIPRVITTVVLSSIPLAVYGILEHMGIDAHLWVQDVQKRVFSTFGQPNWLAAYLCLLLPLSWIYLLPTQQPLSEKPASKYKYLQTLSPYLITLIFFLTLLYTRSRSGFLAFLIADATFWTLLFTQYRPSFTSIRRDLTKPFILIHILYSICALTSSTPFTPSLIEYFQTADQTNTAISSTSGGTESGEIRQIVWKGAWELGKKFPLVGTGLETFGYAYYLTRPIEHNLVSEWDFLYNKAHNEYLNIWANMGSLGISSYAIFVVTATYFALHRSRSKPHTSKNSKNKISSSPTVAKNIPAPYSAAFLAAYISILVTNFFGFSVVVIGIYTFLLPAMWITIRAKPDLKRFQVPAIQRSKPIFFAATILIMTIIIFAGISLVNFYRADIYFAKAQKLSLTTQPQSAVNLIQKAIALQPRQALFHDQASQQYADLSIQAFTNRQATLSAELAGHALEESATAITLNPHHLNLWKSRASVFITLATSNPNYLEYAIQSLQNAMLLAPTDPKITYNLGLLYTRTNQPDKALEIFKHTLLLKPDYTDALYALALLYHEEAREGDKLNTEYHNLAIQYLQSLMRLTPQQTTLTDTLNRWQAEATITSLTP